MENQKTAMEMIDGLRIEVRQYEKCPTLWCLTSPDMKGLLVIAKSPEECREDGPAVIAAMREARVDKA